MLPILVSRIKAVSPVGNLRYVNQMVTFLTCNGISSSGIKAMSPACGLRFVHQMVIQVIRCLHVIIALLKFIRSGDALHHCPTLCLMY